jgi:RNA polymerase sigma factor (sigma-70 family)
MGFELIDYAAALEQSMVSTQATTACRDPFFAATHWSVVLAARDGTSSQCREALEELCRSYWYALYGYVRRRGYTHEDAADLTQEFFLRLNAPNFLASVNSEKGKFRSFLLASLNHFLANEWHRANTQKRGGQARHVPIESEAWENRHLADPATPEGPASFFDKQWALTILERALDALRKELVASGRQAIFDHLMKYLTDASAGKDYSDVAAQLQMKPGAVAVAVHRLRARYREIVRASVAQTVESEADMESEMSYLLSVLSR